MTHESIVLLSPNDGDLLIKAHDMLVQEGFKSDEKWNSVHNPTNDNHRAVEEERSIWYYALGIYEDATMTYHNHDCRLGYPIHLTPDNLQESVQYIIDNFKS